MQPVMIEVLTTSIGKLRMEAVQHTAPPPSASRPARRGARTVLAHLAPTTWAYLDLLVTALGTFGSYRLFFEGNPDYRWIVGPWINVVAFGISIPVAGLVFGLYERATFTSRSRIIVRSTTSVLCGLVVAYAIISVLFYGETTRWLGLGVIVSHLCIALPTRLAVFHRIVNAQETLLFVGYPAAMGRLIRWMRTDARKHYRLLGCIEPPHASLSTASNAYEEISAFGDAHCDDDAAPPPRVAQLDELPAWLATQRIDTVVVDTDVVSAREAGEAILTCLDHRCRVIDHATFLEKHINQVPAESITAQWFLNADLQAAGGFEAVKRLTDVAAATFGILIALPLWPVIALLIRFDSRGPVLFAQARVGLHGRIFTMYKFRTMRTDAEANGAVWAKVNDTRITRLGRFLRKSRLDELPQLWNILIGDMSLVGPRPERPEFVRQLAKSLPHYAQRHLIRPGLTGWAQIHYGYGANLTDAYRKLCYDLYYLKHRSLDLDTAIIIRTIGRVCCGSR